jgi:hypothetical protein
MHWSETPRLRQLPSSDERLTIAVHLGRDLLNRLGERPTAAAAAHELGWLYTSRPFECHGTEALLIPLLRGDFSVAVNSSHHPSQERQAWLLAHEIGHSLFWVPGTPPRRLAPHSQAEEGFCDAFADDLSAVMGETPQHGSRAA